MTSFRTLLFAKLVMGGAVATLVLSGQAHAAFLQVSSLAASTPVVFSDAPGSTYAAGTPVSYTASGQTATFTGLGDPLERDQTNSTYLDNNYADGTQLIGLCGFSACSPTGSLSVAFSGPVLGFSLAADDFDTTQGFVFQVTAFNGTTVLGTATASSLADNGASPAILAATSTSPITSIVISDAPGGGGAGDGAFVIGNIATVPVPEPGSIVLLAGGILGLVGLMRRRP